MSKGCDDAINRTHFLPIQRHEVVLRDSLINRTLNTSPALIVLHGPGGIGKSVAAAQIAEAFVSQTRNADAVWVRFREDLVGCESVWQHILTECTKAGTFRTNSVAERIARGGTYSPNTLIRALNERTSPLLLVLDSAQKSITTEVEESILDALEQSPGLTVAITTRRPLPLLGSTRAALRIPITLLNTQDLHMSEAEVQRLVNLRSPGDENRQAVAHAVHQHSRGWPLAVHALLVERRNRVQSMTVPPDTAPQRTFITEIVDSLLDSADSLTQPALYVLAQYYEVTADVLASTLGIPLDKSAEVLDKTLIGPLDYWIDSEGARWYQLHDLVAEEIRQRQDDLVSAADRMLYGKRITVLLKDARPRIAIQAAIIAQEWELLSDLLLSGAAITLERQQLPVTLRDIPENVRAKYPVIATFSLIHEYAFPSGVIGKAVAGFRAYSSRKLIAETNQPGFPGATAAILKMVISRITGQEKLAAAMAQKVTEKLESFSDEELQRYSVPLQIGVAQTVITHIHAGNFSEARKLLNILYMWREHLQPKNRAHTTALVAWVAAFCGDIGEATRFLDESEHLDVPIGWRDSYIGAGYRIAAALNALEQAEHELAQRHIDAMAAHESTIEHWPYLAYVQALTIEARDGTGAALIYLKSRASRKGARTSATVFMRELLTSLEARLSWQQGRILPPRKNRPNSIGSVYVALSRNETTTAAAVCASLEESDTIRQSSRAQTELLLLQAVLAFQRGDTSLAADRARVATSIMEANGTRLPMRSVPQQIAHGLQELVPELPAHYAAESILHDLEPLSPAEHNALIAIAENGTISQAAKVMYLSRETVKGYMKNVYRKLKVNSRDEAVAVASATGLLSHPSKEDNGAQ